MKMKQRVALENLILPEDASLHELSITVLLTSYKERQELSMVLCIWDKIAHKKFSSQNWQYKNILISPIPHLCQLCVFICVLFSGQSFKHVLSYGEHKAGKIPAPQMTIWKTGWKGVMLPGKPNLTIGCYVLPP